MSNEPTYVDRGEQLSRKKVYYHSGLDLGGPEAMAQVVAATDGVVVSLGKEVLPEHAKGTPIAQRYDVIYLLDSRGGLPLQPPALLRLFPSNSAPPSNAATR